MPEYGRKRVQQAEERVREEWESAVKAWIDEGYAAVGVDDGEQLMKSVVVLYDLFGPDDVPHLFDREVGETGQAGLGYHVLWTCRWAVTHFAESRGVETGHGLSEGLAEYGEMYEVPVFRDLWRWIAEQRFRGDSRHGGLAGNVLVVRALETLELLAREVDALPEVEEETYTIGEDFEESPLHEMWAKRRRQGRILTALIVARDGQTGVGKTTLGVSLCKTFDEKWSAERAANRAWEYRQLLDSEPKGSVLLADEFAQMFDARRSMSTSNVEATQDWQMLRKLEVSTVGTCPSPGAVDTRFLKLMDVQLLVTRRGHARVYRMKQDDMTGELFREHLCNIEWGDLDDDEDYQQIESMKEERLSERLNGGDDGPDEEDTGPEEARREGRNETIRQLVENGMSQSEVAERLEMHQSTVSRIVREGE